MPFLDNGLIQMGSFIRGENPTPPNYCEFGVIGSDVEVGSPHLGSGLIRKPISWDLRGTDPVGLAELTTLDLNGSVIHEIGIAPGSEVGSNLYTRDLSAIGSKNNTFNVQVNFEVRLRRPLS